MSQFDFTTVVVASAIGGALAGALWGAMKKGRRSGAMQPATDQNSAPTSGRPARAPVNRGLVLVHIVTLLAVLNVLVFAISKVTGPLSLFTIALLGTALLIVGYFIIGLLVKRSSRRDHLGYVALGATVGSVVVNAAVRGAVPSLHAIVLGLIFAFFQNFLALGIGRGLLFLVSRKGAEQGLPPADTGSSIPPPSYPMAPGYPPPSYPQMPPTPPRKRPIGLIVTLIVVAVALLCTCTVGTLVALNVAMKTTNVAGRTASPVSSTPTPAATPTAVRTVVYQNTFAANANGWTQDSHCFEGTGGYHIANNSACYAPIGAQTDVDISVQAKQATGATVQPFGIIFGLDDANTEYRFMIDSSGTWVLDSCTATTCGLVMDGGYAGRGGGVDNTLEVNVKGKRFNLDVNGERVYYNYDSASYTGGRIGLAVSNASEVVFSDLVIARIA